MLKDKIGKLTSIIFYSLISIRYVIKLKNIELIKDGEGLLFLSNHPALIDPIILTGVIGKRVLFSPVISKDYSKLPLLSSIFSYFEAEYIDNMGSHEDFQENIISLRNKLLRKENILLYPAGSIYSKGMESISNKRMAYTLVKEWAHRKVIGIRIDGLWGSIWSKAVTGNVPNIGKVLILGLYYVIVNGFFFLPKREVTISFHDITKDIELWSLGDKTNFNKSLEDFYNNLPTQEKYIPHYFYYDDTQKITADKLSEIQVENDLYTMITEDDLSFILFSDLKEIIERVKQREIANLEWKMHLIEDLELDSLDMMEIKILLHGRFPEASNTDIQSMKTLKDIGKMALGKSKSIDTHSPLLGIVLRGFLRSLDGNKVGILLNKKKGDELISILRSLGKIGIFIIPTEHEESFIKNFQQIDSKIIITSKYQVNSIRFPWFAKYEHNTIFIEDIVSRRSSGRRIHLFLLGLMPPYRSRK